jgi:hypothetical protein
LIHRRICAREISTVAEASMLQDGEAGRALETEALIGAILERQDCSPGAGDRSSLCVGEAAQ